MKKILKISGVVLAIVLVILITIPYLFSGKIETLVKKEANAMLNAELNFSSLNLSLIRNFPKASISLNDFYIKGNAPFEKDTLVSGKDLTATINLFSLFGDSGYTIDKILLDESKVKAIVLKDGQVNWDIMKSSEESANEENEQDNSEGFSLKINRVAIDDFSLIFDDQQGKQYAQIDHLNLILAGDLSSEKTKLNIETELPNIKYVSEGSTLLNNVAIDAKINLDADFKENKYTLNKNEVILNAIKTNLDGWVQLNEDSSIAMDIKLNTDKVSFKEILSLIPSVFMDDDFKKVKTEGKVELNAFAKGVYKENSLPHFDLTLNVEDASIQYPSVPASINQINIHANVNNPGGSADLTKIKVSPLNLTIAGNPIAIKANLANPISDPKFDISLNGLLDLGKIKEIYPIEEAKLMGLIDVDMSILGQLSYIEKELYDKIVASGKVKVSDLEVNMKDVPKVQIQKSLMTFTSKYLQLDETTILIGENDITLNSKLSNYIGYAMKGSTINGSLNLTSTHFNVNDLMSGEETTSDETSEEINSVIEVPKNVNFNMNANFKEVIYDNITLSNLNGKIVVKNGKADMSNLSFNTFDGKVKMNGYYSTQTPKSPKVNANLDLTNLSFSKTYDGLNIVRQLAPIFSSLNGAYAGKLNLQTELNEKMEPITNKLQAKGTLNTDNVNIKDVKIIQELAKVIKQDDLVNRPMKDINLDFEVKDGRLSTKPFDFKIGNYNVNLSGTTGIDKTIDYSAKIKLPAGATKLDGFDNVAVLIGGTFSKPTFKIDTASMMKESGKALGNKAKEMIQKELFKNKKDSTDNKEDIKEEIGDAINNLFKKKK